MTVAVVCIALLGVLLFGLGFAVSLTRVRTNVAFGFTPDPTDPLYKVSRAHGNTAEYAPMLAVLILVAGATEPAAWVLWTMGLAVLSRYLLAIGIVFGSTMGQPHPLRFVGATGTYATGLALCAALLLGA